MARTCALSVIERERRKSFRDILREAQDQLLAPEAVAADLGVSVQTLGRWMEKEGAEFVRTIRIPEKIAVTTG